MGKPQIFESSTSSGPHLLFFLGEIMWWALAKPTCLVAMFSRCRNIKGNAHFSFGCNFMMRLGKTKLHTKFEVATFWFFFNISQGCMTYIVKVWWGKWKIFYCKFFAKSNGNRILKIDQYLAKLLTCRWSFLWLTVYIALPSQAYKH